MRFGLRLQKQHSKQQVHGLVAVIKCLKLTSQPACQEKLAQPTVMIHTQSTQSFNSRKAHLASTSSASNSGTWHQCCSGISVIKICEKYTKATKNEKGIMHRNKIF